MNIVFHGRASTYSEGFADLLDAAHVISVLPDQLDTSFDHEVYAGADVIVGVRFDTHMPQPAKARLFQVPGAGIDSIDLNFLPPQTVVCNCFGHEQAVSEFAMAALLQHYVPLAAADRALRAGAWGYSAGASDRVHDEIGDKVLGILGFGHIGQAVAKRAKSFGMKVYVANRSPIGSNDVDRYFDLSDLDNFWSSADAIVVCLPLTSETRGLVSTHSFSKMKPTVCLINVARGPVIAERALFEALSSRRIAGAVIDAWYTYPSAATPRILPSGLPFHQLSNIVMTPHMSGWTIGTIRRRQVAIAENICRLDRGVECQHVVRPRINALAEI